MTMQDNPLAAPPGPSVPPIQAGAGAPGLPPAMPHPEAVHNAARANYDKLQSTMKIMDSVRQELTTLTKLGDTVTPEDVIKGAGNLVASGSDPKDLATLLADMPTNGGQSLASWVQQHAANATQREQQLSQAMGLARQQLATAAMQLLVHHALGAPGPGPNMTTAPGATGPTTIPPGPLAAPNG